MDTRKSQSNKIIKMDRLALLSGVSISQGEIKRGGAVDRKLRELVVNQTQTNNTAPRPIKEEINQLAKAWCELLLGQVMEARNQRN